MGRAVVEGINYNRTDANPFPVGVMCPTGTCHSQRYSTLAVYNRLEDVRWDFSYLPDGKLTIPYNACNYTLPDGRFLPVSTTDHTDQPLPRNRTGLPLNFTGGTTYSNKTAMSWRPAAIPQLFFIEK